VVKKYIIHVDFGNFWFHSVFDKKVIVTTTLH